MPNDTDNPVTRRERFLAGASGESIVLDQPITREERYLAKAAGMDVKTDAPQTRAEKYLAKIAEGGGGGGGDVPAYTGAYTVTPSEQTQTLATKNKKATNDITVNPIPSSYIVPTGTKQITENGTGIDVAAFSDVDVAVPTGITPSGTISITENGQVDVTNYATANVNVGGSSTDPVYFMISVAGNYPSQAPTVTSFNVNFESNGQTFDKIQVKKSRQSRYGACSITYFNGDDSIEVASYSASSMSESAAKNIDNYTFIDNEYKRIVITGGTDAQNAVLLAALLRIDVWTEPATYDPDTMYFYLDTPFDNFQLSYAGIPGTGATMNDGKGNSRNLSTASVSYEFKGKYILSIKCAAMDLLTYNGGWYSIFANALAQSAVKKIRFAQNGSLYKYASRVQGYSPETYAFKDFVNATVVENLNVYGDYSFVSSAIENANLVLDADSIGTQAFYGCLNLKEVSIPSGITAIGSGAFGNCINLKEIHFEATTPPAVANSNAFSGVPTTCKIYVPTGSLSAYTSATNYPSSATYTYVEE